MLASICKSLAMSSDFQPVPLVHADVVARLDLSDESFQLKGNYQAIEQQVIEAIETKRLDCAIVIAPEVGGELERLIGILRGRTKLWNCSGRFLELGCDKWKLAQYCAQNYISHPQTALLGQLTSPSEWQQFPSQVAIKRRDGAGCMDITVHENWRLARQFANSNDLYNDSDNWIVQDWIDGQHASRSMVCNGMDFQAMPIVGQQIVLENPAELLGASIPHYEGAGEMDDVKADLCLNVMEKLQSEFKSECLGWVSFDILIPDELTLGESYYLIEINPRFTTSFAFLQQSSQQSIIELPLANFINRTGGISSIAQ